MRNVVPCLDWKLPYVTIVWLLSSCCLNFLLFVFVLGCLHLKQAISQVMTRTMELRSFPLARRLVNRTQLEKSPL